jgi:hypothetical protein
MAVKNRVLMAHAQKGINFSSELGSIYAAKAPCRLIQTITLSAGGAGVEA